MFLQEIKAIADISLLCNNTQTETYEGEEEY
jgi:hypothetical protein